MAGRHREQKRGRQTEQHHSVERLERPHHLPVNRKKDVRMAIARYRAQRVEHRDLRIRGRAERDICARPSASFDGVKHGHEQDDRAQHPGESRSRRAGAKRGRKPSEDAIADPEQAERVDGREPSAR